MDHDEGTTTLPWEPSPRESPPPGLEDVLRANLEGELHELRPEPGLVIDDKWELTNLLGTGGFGQVYEAWHLQLDHPVAIKFLDPRHGGPEVRRRFLEEARLMAGMANEHLVRASDYGELPNGAPYFVMELVKGRTVRHHMREPLSISRAVEIVEGILEGLSALHGRGVVHVDIKPENIIIGDQDGKVRLLDFGLAHRSAPLEGNSGGTPPYMAPEVLLDGAPAGPRSDVYAVGVVAYEMLTARLPRGHASMDFEKMGRSWASRPNADPIRMHRPEVPQALDVFVTESLSRDPLARPKSAYVMLISLREILPRIIIEIVAETLPQQEDASWSTKPIPTDGQPTVRRERWAAQLAVLGIALTAWLIGHYGNSGAEEPKRVVASLDGDDEPLGREHIESAWTEGVGESSADVPKGESPPGDASAVAAEADSSAIYTESEHLDESADPPASSTSSSVPAVEPESKALPQPTLRDRYSIVPSDAALRRKLERKIKAKCAALIAEDQRVTVMFFVTQRGGVTSMTANPKNATGECAKQQVSETQFRVRGGDETPMKIVVK